MSDLRTNSYMSPEVIRGMGYGFSCDWWSLGVIGKFQEHLLVYYLRMKGEIGLISLPAFECLYGYPPFVSNSVSLVQHVAVGDAKFGQHQRHLTRQKM